MTKQQAISIILLKKIADGMTAAEAMDDTFGPGTTAKLAGEVYDAIRAKA